MAGAGEMKPEAGHELEEENKSWEGAEIKWAPLIVKAIIASILTAISMYVTYDGWVTGEVDTSNMFIFKCLACALSVFLTLPNLYQVRARDARGSSMRETGRLSHAREPCHVDISRGKGDEPKAAEGVAAKLAVCGAPV